MKPVYIDLHIHTSDDPNNLKTDYDIDVLIEKIKEKTHGFDSLISFTDHNTINKEVYLLAKDKVPNLIIGAELHVRHDDKKRPYHCHIYFKTDIISSSIIDEINIILDEIYPSKIIAPEDDAPLLQKIINKFHAYDFILLPHAGQKHSVFNQSIPSDASLDNIIEKSIYYNFFDGFTARGDGGREKTDEYFKKLGIDEFTNLITCSDNYNPQKYPNAKDDNASKFIPTWMLALPTFDGLRLSLSEKSRLFYSDEPPVINCQYIRSVRLQNEKININVTLTPGLNVVIGGSSCGKTLFVDSLYKKIVNKIYQSDYINGFKVDDIIIENPNNITPHYISQSFINGVIDSKDQYKKIDDIEIIKKVFPSNLEAQKLVDLNFSLFKEDILELFDCVEKVELAENSLKKIANLSQLININNKENNIIENIIISMQGSDKFRISNYDYNRFINNLSEIRSYLLSNPLIIHNDDTIQGLQEEINLSKKYSDMEERISLAINEAKEKIDLSIEKKDKISFSKNNEFSNLLKYALSYAVNYRNFKSKVCKIAKYKIQQKTSPILSMGHSLFIENLLILNDEKVIDSLNYFLKKEFLIEDLKGILPEKLFKERWNKSRGINNYHDFGTKICNKFSELNIIRYSIVTKDGIDYYNLSPGKKASVILDLVLGYTGDRAPLIIDQPEDNLSSEYINNDLITSIKKLKMNKQIIIVSHNATIPMIGDAENIILCVNNNNKILIKAGKLEEKIDDVSVIDHIARVTDGGKSSIKKRLKKYNIKKFNN